MLVSDVCLSDVCRIYIRRNLRTERPRKTKIATEVAHVTFGHHFQGQKVKGQLVADALNSQLTCRNRCRLANKCENIVKLQAAEAYRGGRPPIACFSKVAKVAKFVK